MNKGEPDFYICDPTLHMVMYAEHGTSTSNENKATNLLQIKFFKFYSKKLFIIYNSLFHNFLLCFILMISALRGAPAKRLLTLMFVVINYLEPHN